MDSHHQHNHSDFVLLASDFLLSNIMIKMCIKTTSLSSSPIVDASYPILVHATQFMGLLGTLGTYVATTESLVIRRMPSVHKTMTTYHLRQTLVSWDTIWVWGKKPVLQEKTLPKRSWTFFQFTTMIFVVTFYGTVSNPKFGINGLPKLCAYR